MCMSVWFIFKVVANVSMKHILVSPYKTIVIKLWMVMHYSSYVASHSKRENLQ